MTIRHNFEIRLIIFLFCILFCLQNITSAEDAQTNSAWKCFNLLDNQTQSSLSSKEQFFADLFQLPSEYKQATETEKTRLINQWSEDLNGNDNEKTIQAAAYLGIVKANNAAKHLERLMSSGKCGGRLRWVCTRSLGQTGDKGTIPILISLLDSQNMETRLYSKVSLAEITGVYYGDDKEKWKNWQNGKQPQLCTSEECKVAAPGSKTSEPQRSSSNNKLEFVLPDIYERIVDSQDYNNTPVLIMSGSCWCGGCQQDTEPFRKFVAEYESRGLAAIRTVAGDNELAALDFQKHYRLPFVQLLDTNRSFEKRYNDDGWTFLMLADREGRIIYKANSPEEKNWNELRIILDKMLSSPVSNKTIIRDGIAYMPATLQRSGEIDKQRICERFPSVACGPNGQTYVVFTTNKNTSSDVFIRVFDGAKWSEDMPIAAAAADEYDGTVLVDKQGHIWVFWTSNASDKYETFVMSFENPSQLGTPVRLTASDDDTMHPRMACDKNGCIWVAYYKWHKMKGYSRDKEVYVQKYENGKWSGEVHVSPTDVPEYEDHSDPAIVAYDNGVVVAWSWDFHPASIAYSNQAGEPTIFMRPITADLQLGKVSCISEKNIDVTPVLTVSTNRQIWCAWDSLGRNRQKNICISNVSLGRNNPISGILSMNNPAANVCTPSFSTGSKDQIALTWSEKVNNKYWILKRADYDRQSNKWSQPQIIETQNNPRYCSSAYDSNDNLWLVYSVDANEGRKITIENTGKISVKSVPSESSVTSPGSADNINAAKKLRQLIDENYSYRDLRVTDWDRLFGICTPQLERAGTPQEFAEAAAKMLLNAKDSHLWVKINDKTINGFKRDIETNYDISFLKKEIPNWNDLSPQVSTGQFPDGIGYILIKSWTKNESQVLTPALQAIRNLSNSKALIIDIRPNGGGTESFAQKVAGCFVQQPVVYAKHIYRNAKTKTGWGQVQERTLNPNADMPSYKGKIAVLMGQSNFSSCESFILMMKQVPDCKLIGEKSYGSSGNPKPYELGNGVTVWLPSWKDLKPDGICFEGQGIEPDITVIARKIQVQQKDPVLEAAVRYIRSTF